MHLRNYMVIKKKLVQSLMFGISILLLTGIIGLISYEKEVEAQVVQPVPLEDSCVKPLKFVQKEQRFTKDLNTAFSFTTYGKSVVSQGFVFMPPEITGSFASIDDMDLYYTSSFSSSCPVKVNGIHCADTNSGKFLERSNMKSCIKELKLKEWNALEIDCLNATPTSSTVGSLRMIYTTSWNTCS